MHLITNCDILETTLYNEHGEKFCIRSYNFLQIVIRTTESDYEEFSLCDLKSPQNTLHKKRYFPFRISLVNMTNS